MAHDGQPQAGAAGGPAAAVVDSVEALEDALEVPGGDAHAGVGHRQADLLAVPAARDAHGAAVVGEGHGVLQQGVDGRDQLAAVAHQEETFCDLIYLTFLMV